MDVDSTLTGLGIRDSSKREGIKKLFEEVKELADELERCDEAVTKYAERKTEFISRIMKRWDSVRNARELKNIEGLINDFRKVIAEQNRFVESMGYKLEERRQKIIQLSGLFATPNKSPEGNFETFKTSAGFPSTRVSKDYLKELELMLLKQLRYFEENKGGIWFFIRNIDELRRFIIEEHEFYTYESTERAKIREDLYASLKEDRFKGLSEKNLVFRLLRILLELKRMTNRYKGNFHVERVLVFNTNYAVKIGGVSIGVEGRKKLLPTIKERKRAFQNVVDVRIPLDTEFYANSEFIGLMKRLILCFRDIDDFLSPNKLTSALKRLFGYDYSENLNDPRVKQIIDYTRIQLDIVIKQLEEIVTNRVGEISRDYLKNFVSLLIRAVHDVYKLQLIINYCCLNRQIKSIILFIKSAGGKGDLIAGIKVFDFLKANLPKCRIYIKTSSSSGERDIMGLSGGKIIEGDFKIPRECDIEISMSASDKRPSEAKAYINLEEYDYGSKVGGVIHRFGFGPETLGILLNAPKPLTKEDTIEYFSNYPQIKELFKQKKYFFAYISIFSIPEMVLLHFLENGDFCAKSFMVVVSTAHYLGSGGFLPEGIGSIEENKISGKISLFTISRGTNRLTVLNFREVDPNVFVSLLYNSDYLALTTGDQSISEAIQLKKGFLYFPVSHKQELIVNLVGLIDRFGFKEYAGAMLYFISLFEGIPKFDTPNEYEKNWAKEKILSLGVREYTNLADERLAKQAQEFCEGYMASGYHMWPIIEMVYRQWKAYLDNEDRILIENLKGL